MAARSASTWACACWATAATTCPQMTTYGPDGDTSRYLDPSVIGSHVLVRTLQENTDTIKQARFTATWKAGQPEARWRACPRLDDNFTLQGSNTFANNFWQAYCGLRRAFGPHFGCARAVQPSISGTIGTSGFIPGFSGRRLVAAGIARVQPVRSVRIPARAGQSVGPDRSTGFQLPGDGMRHAHLGNSLANCARRSARCAYHGSLDSAPAASRTSRRRPGRCSCSAQFDTEIGGQAIPFHRRHAPRAHGRFVRAASAACRCCSR